MGVTWLGHVIVALGPRAEKKAGLERWQGHTMTATKKKTPNPIDVHVGSRIRLRRTMIGMSQEKLGESLGITFQQVQKYEKGTNRVGASRLQNISAILNVPVSYFFEDAPGGDASAGGFEENSASQVVNFLSTTEGLQLNRAFVKVSDPKVRRRIIELVRSLADGEESSAS